MIREKASIINSDFVKHSPPMSDNGRTSQADKGWLHNFKARTEVHSITRNGEAASAHKMAAENYIHHFKTMTQRNSFYSH